MATLLALLALLAERDADTRLMYAEHLRQLTYGVDEADDGREALYRQRTRKVRRVG